MKTFDEIVKWVQKNVPKKDLEDHPSARSAAEWFVAYTEASMMRESNTTKDWAHLLLVGVKPLIPTATVRQWAENCGNDGENEPVSERELRLFFGLPKQEQS